MPAGQWTPVLRYLTRLSGAAVGASLSDGQLLDRFVHSRDETAFAALLRRHGPMVLGVCRRMLRDVHDTEDAFQATFLLLVRKARSLREPDLLGPWLHGVAHRTALKARCLARKRHVRQHALVDVPAAPHDDGDWRDLRPVLDDAIRQLPRKYRTPFVLCHLEGMTNAQAADRLGCPLGTIATRLSRARERLRKHLMGRGVVLSASALGLTLAANAAAEAVPLWLVQGMTEIASLWITTKAAGAGAISGTIAALMKGVGRAMLMEKLRFVCFATLTVVGTVSVGAGLLVLRAGAAQPPVAEQPTLRQGPATSTPAASTSPTPQPESITTATTPPKPTGGSRKHQPKGPPPITAMAVLDGEGRLVLRFPASAYYYQPKTTYQRLPDGSTTGVTSYEMVSREEVRLFELKDLQAFSTDGKRLESKALAEMLKKEIPLLVSANGQPVDPFHLQLIKEGTVVLVLPMAPVPTPPLVESYVPLGQPPTSSVVPPPTSAEPTVYQRVAPPVGK